MTYRTCASLKTKIDGEVQGNICLFLFVYIQYFSQLIFSLFVFHSFVLYCSVFHFCIVFFVFYFCIPLFDFGTWRILQARWFLSEATLACVPLKLLTKASETTKLFWSSLGAKNRKLLKEENHHRAE